ncbi:MAG: hypothetical protein ACLUOI_17350 [Eisenbergiella sp.]
MLDLCTVGVPKWKVLLVLPTAFRKHYRYNGVERYGGQTIHITPPLLYGSIPTAR